MRHNNRYVRLEHRCQRDDGQDEEGDGGQVDGEQVDRPERIRPGTLGARPVY
ncbi:hypothetical protein [Streptomyces sp. AC495_CC817]|uniref:hypothetical protein n=1 Tax=Streptomyces sp. AC495_CC817 TaxID=2823900 RepID=UPI001C264EC3|nr:hypothetical protein [Streptomyces sp. AC495_CC817]